MRKKIAAALAAGFTLGTMFIAPAATPVVEAAEESVLKLKSPAETYAAQGDKLFDEGKFEEAAEAYKKAAKEAKSNAEYWFNSGLASYKANDFVSAADCFKKAVDLEPNNGIYNNWCGVAYSRRMRSPRSSFGGTTTDTLIERAIKYTARGAELLPEDVNAQLAAGNVAEFTANYYSRRGGYRSYISEEYHRAYQYYRKAVEIDPTNAENVATLSKFCQDHSGYGFQPYNPAPQPSTETPGQPDAVAPSGTISTADIEYEILDSGAVKFKVRCPAKLSDDEDGFILYDETNNYIFTKPEKFKHHHGTYVTGWLSDDGIMYISNAALPNAFDYDPKTQSFTFYFWFGAGLVDGDNPNEDYYTNRMRLIDKNTVYNEHFSADSRVIGGFPRVTATNTYRYMTCDAIPLDKIVDETKREIKVHYRSDGTISSAWENYDANKCVWFGEHPEYFYREGNGRLNAMVDMMRAFLAVNGNIGESPYEVQYSDFGK